MAESDVQSRASQGAGRFQVRLNQVDYLLVPPGQLDNSNLPRVPVLRAFGPSSSGQATCVHVHQVYPYFFIEYPGKIDPRHVTRYITKLFHSLNHAIALSLKRHPRSPTSQFIRAIILVKGIHFYGFHTSYSPFLKVLVADPTYTNRMVTILQSGSVMSTCFRVHESHLSYILQFLCDFGLYGCGVMEIEDALERCPEADERANPPAPVARFRPSSYFRESRVPLELDVIAPHILNRHRLVARHLHHRLTIPSPKLISDPLVLSVRELWEDERNHRKGLGLHPSPVIPVDPSESSRTSGGEWVAEARWWEELQKRLSLEQQVDVEGTNEQEQDWERYVMTTFESIEAIWEEEYKAWKPVKRDTSNQKHEEKIVPPVDFACDPNGKHIQVDVDLSLLTSDEISQLDQQEVQDEWGNKNPDEFEEAGEEDPTYDEDVEAHDDEVAAEKDDDTPTTSPLDPFLPSPKDDHTIQEYRLPSPPIPVGLTTSLREGSPTPTRTSLLRPLLAVPIGVGNRVLYAEDGNRPSGLLPSKVNFVLPETGGKDPRALSDSPIDGGVSEEEENPFTSPHAQLDANDRALLVSARAVQPSAAFRSCKVVNNNRYTYARPPPSISDLQASFKTLELPSKLYQAPYYSRDADVPDTAKEYAGLSYRLKGGKGISTLEEWASSPTQPNLISNQSTVLDPSGVGGWEYAAHPPSGKEIRRSVAIADSRRNNAPIKQRLRSQIEGPTQRNIYGFKTSLDGARDISREKTNMSIMSLEIFVPTSDGRVPNPEHDEIHAIFYAYHVPETEVSKTGAIVLKNNGFDDKRLRHFKFEFSTGELDLVNDLIDLVTELDPDIITGWDVQGNSWGYLEARGKTLGLTFSDLISRAPPKSSSSTNDQWDLRKSSTLKVAGRHVLNLWRIMRAEKTLTIYTFENVAFNVLRKRLPKYSYRTLTDWYRNPVPAHTNLLVRHLLLRVMVNLELLEETDTVTKTAEFARVFGIDFFSVISRGSQFKVESFMFRIAKPESFVLISPSRDDVGRQNAAECMPLIMEPASAFYSSPLVVLDFQSLYPSIMIAHNYCYSTCLGRIKPFRDKYKFGVVDDFQIGPEILAKLQEHITVAPNGIMYVKPHARRGLLGRMLIELLETRVMVKQAMKTADKARRRILDARQLSLKYIANVTYGYTGATFSGRMPAVEIADSIVQSGRETLEKAIDVINGTPKWGGQVVYGDTDSVFVYLLGKTKDQAFAIGNEIAETITSMNPSPVKLKFEKVYLPCLLMAKKRYVGFKYESIDEAVPTFDAKGIETVRRDGVLAQRKMVEICLKILFRTQDLSAVKDHCCRSWTKILENKAPVQDFIFSKEVRMGTYSDKGPPPPGAVVAARRTVNDPNNEALYGERIPYVITRGIPGARLVERAMDPLEMMNSQLQLDATYYITRVLIPPLERIFNLVGADVKQWFNEMPKSTIPELVSPRKSQGVIVTGSPDGLNINEHFLNVQCLSCGAPASQYLCDVCCYNTEETISNLESRIQKREDRMLSAHRICVTCTGSDPIDPIHCESLDCPWFYARRKAETAMELVPIFQELSDDVATGFMYPENVVHGEDADGDEIVCEPHQSDTSMDQGEQMVDWCEASEEQPFG